MSEELNLGPKLPELVSAIVGSYQTHPECRHIDQAYLPSKQAVEELVERLLELVYPGFYGRQDLTQHNVSFHVGELLPRIGHLAHEQILKSISYMDEVEGRQSADGCEEQACAITEQFLNSLVGIREQLDGDVKAAFDGDPAAVNCDEIILAYPGMVAVSVHRFAHVLYRLGVPLVARILAEWAHRQTGVDIHPGAQIGKDFFIDHGTGVVIGETTIIGDSVKVYQGVTLGALSFPKDERGRLIRGEKRHPTVEDNVTLYANAIVLGGDTVIGRNSVIGGSVFITTSVPPYSTVTFKPPELRIKGHPLQTGSSTSLPDYQI